MKLLTFLLGLMLGLAAPAQTPATNPAMIQPPGRPPAAAIPAPAEEEEGDEELPPAATPLPPSLQPLNTNQPELRTTTLGGAPAPTTAPAGPPPPPSVPALPARIIRQAVSGATNAVPGRQPIPIPIPAKAATSGPPAGPVPATPAAPKDAIAAAGNATVTPAPTTATNTVDGHDFSLQAMPLEQALDVYADFVGRTLLRPAQLPPIAFTLKTQAKLTRQEAIQAFDSVFALNGLTMIPVGEKFITVVPMGQALQEAAAFRKKDSEELPEASQYVTQIVQLKNIKPQEALQVLQPFAKIPNSILGIDASMVLVIRDYAANVKRMLEIIEKIDTVVPPEFELEVVPIKYALASDIANVISSLASGGSVTTSGSGTGTGGGLSGMSGMGGLGTRSGMGSRGGMGSRYGGYGSSYGGYGAGGGYGGSVYPYAAATTPLATQPAQAGANRSNFQNRLQQIVNKASQGEFQVLGEARLIADERTNAILIFANKQDMKMIKRIVGELDKVQAQVLIEAIILEVSLKHSRTLGTSVSMNPRQDGRYTQGAASLFGPGFLNNITNFPGGLSGNSFSYLGTYNQQYDVAFKALEDGGRIKVLSRPRIQTSHAVRASLEIGETRPYISSSSPYYGGGVGGYGGYSQYTSRFIGIGLDVLPLINQDGLVVMEISQNISQPGTDVIIDGNPVPATTERNAQATVAVRDGESVVLGGFINNDRRNSRTGVPVLKDVPLLGMLFRSSSASFDRTELVVMIRPTVLRTPEIAAVNATNEASRLSSGLREAAREYFNEERQRQEAIDKKLERKGMKDWSVVPERVTPSEPAAETGGR